ncbi:hypothetical protein ABPG72_020917 [Tetrahymena utriculariae]
MGQNNQKSNIFYSNELAEEGDFLKSKYVTNSRVLYLKFIDSDKSLIEKACINLLKCLNLTDLTINQKLQEKNFYYPQKLLQLYHDDDPLNRNPRYTSFYHKNGFELDQSGIFDGLSSCQSLTNLSLIGFKTILMPKLGFLLGKIQNLQSLKIDTHNKVIYPIKCTEGEVFSGISFCKNLKNLDVSFLMESQLFELNKTQNITLFPHFTQQKIIMNI